MKNIYKKRKRRSLHHRSAWVSAAAAVVAIVAMAAACNLQPSVYFEGGVSGDIFLPFLSKSEIRRMLEETDAKHLPKELMAIQPNYAPEDATKPWNPGKVKREALDLTLARLNALRRLSGLPAVVMTDEYNESAQYGAALMVLTQDFGHGSQPQPPGVDKASYGKGRGGTEMGNIYPQYRLVESIDGYMLDPGNPGVGHRLWQLSPGLEAVGFGLAPAGPNLPKAGMVERVTYTAAPESQKPRSFDWNFVSWPSAGFFPLGSLFGSPANWSIQLNGSKYTVDKNAVTVRLTRLNDKSEWTFPHVEGNTIIFNKGNGTFSAGERYEVRLQGLKDKEGNPVDFFFVTEFFSL